MRRPHCRISKMSRQFNSMRIKVDLKSACLYFLTWRIKGRTSRQKYYIICTLESSFITSNIIQLKANDQIGIVLTSVV